MIWGFFTAFVFRIIADLGSGVSEILTQLFQILHKVMEPF